MKHLLFTTFFILSTMGNKITQEAFEEEHNKLNNQLETTLTNLLHSNPVIANSNS